MVYLLLLFFFSASIAAMPEDDFARLRSDIFSVSNQSYQAGIEKIDDTLKQYRFQLTLEQQIRLLYSKAIYQHRTNQTQAALVTLHQCKLLSEESAEQSILYSYHNILAGGVPFYYSCRRIFVQRKTQALPNRRGLVHQRYAKHHTYFDSIG